jgi:two-component system phosphate regulon sensor histidine kinase PhoR
MFGVETNLFKQLINAGFDALLIVNEDRRVITMNGMAHTFFGVGDDELGDTLISITRHHQIEQLVEEVFRTREAAEEQIELRDRVVRLRATWITEQQVTMILQDITELTRLTRARRDMVANISHELRTPISSIRLMVDTLTHNYGKNPERDLTKLGKIDRETASLQSLVQELHDLSMIESGKAIMRLIETPFNAIVQDAVTRMSSQLEQRKLDVVNNIPESLVVLADPDQTRRVLTNLLSNSLKFTPVGGRITFQVDQEDVSEQLVTVRVTDTGVGIPPSERTRIFERFYQVDGARSGDHHGSGLGLAIAKHIIEAQGGQIWAEAGFPQGACIAFTLTLGALTSSPSPTFPGE